MKKNVSLKRWRAENDFAKLERNLKVREHYLSEKAELRENGSKEKEKGSKRKKPPCDPLGKVSKIKKIELVEFSTKGLPPPPLVEKEIKYKNTWTSPIQRELWRKNYYLLYFKRYDHRNKIKLNQNQPENLSWPPQ